LTPSTSKADIQVDYLVKKIAVLCEQNKQILAAIKELTEKVDRMQENHK
jgi:fatty acid-binding protein DegV